MPRSLRFFTRVFSAVKDACFSSIRCGWCGQVVKRAEVIYGLCAGCRQDLHLLRGEFCNTCGLPLPGHRVEQDAEFICGSCLVNSPPWSAMAFFNEFSGELRRAIVGCKYKKTFSTLYLLQQLLIWTYEERLAPWRPDMLLAVPMTAKRLVQRGFNQGVELARPLAEKLGAPLGKTVLSRKQDALPQMGLNRAARLQNVKGTISVVEHKVKGLKILLIDDVYTSGATAGECSKVLLRAGAEDVKVLVLARTMANPGQDFS